MGGKKAVQEDMYNIKRLGYNLVSIYAQGHHCEGIKYGPNGEVLGLYDEWLENWEYMVKAIVDNDLKFAVWLQLHETTVYEFRTKKDWDYATQYFCNPEVRDDYMELVMTPILNVLSKYQDNLLYVSLGDELQNQVNDAEMQVNMDNTRNVYGVSLEKMNEFIYQLNDLCKEIIPNVPRTISSNYHYYQYYEDLGLTFFGHNIYHNGGNVDDIEKWKSTLPFMASEFGMNECPDDVTYQRINLEMLQTIREKGYIGANWWYYSPSANSGLWSLFNKEFSFRSDYSDLAMLFSFEIRDSIAARKGEETDFEPAVTFYNNGGGRVAWINSRQAVKFDIERSLDGGAWTKIASDIAVDDPNYMLENSLFMGTYVDVDIVEGQLCKYRIVSYTEDGESNISEPTNEVARGRVITESLVNGSFENGEEGWEINPTYAHIVKNGDDDAAYVADDCDYKLMVPRTEDMNQLIAKQEIPVPPNTTYRFKIKYISKPADIVGTVHYYFYGGDTMNTVKYEWFNKTDGFEAWRPFDQTFNSGEYDKLRLEIYTSNERNMYGDDIYIDSASFMEVAS